jgi:hypothetical protein
MNAYCSVALQNDRPVAAAQSRLKRANLLLPADPQGGAKKLIEVHSKSSRGAIGTEDFLGRSDVTSTEKMENMFLGADTDKKCGDVREETFKRGREFESEL